MEEAAILERLKGVIARNVKHSDIIEVAPTSKFSEDLNMDSLDLVELVMALEGAFSITITDEEAEGLKTVQDAVDFIKVKVD